MYYSYLEIDYITTGFSPARTDLAVKLLTLSRLGKPLVHHVVFSAYTSLKNGPIRMIPIGKVFIDIFEMRSHT
jgi:hypothetical protein